MVDIEETERPRGLLSDADRKYLTNPEEYGTRQSRYKRREAIPERIHHGMLDFGILADPDFPDELLDKAFGVPNNELGSYDGPWAEMIQSGRIDGELIHPAVENGAVNAITLFHRIYPPSKFNDIIEEGVKQAVEYYYPEMEVKDAGYSPTIEKRGAAHDRAKRRLEKERRLTDEMVRLLLEEGEVDPQEVVKHVRNPPEPPKRDRSAIDLFSDVGEGRFSNNS